MDSHDVRILLEATEGDYPRATEEFFAGLTRARGALEQLVKDEPPELPDEPDGGTCPARENGQVCGEDLVLWEMVEYRRDLEWVDGHWVAGPSKFVGSGSDEHDEVMCANLHQWAVPQIEEYQ